MIIVDPIEEDDVPGIAIHHGQGVVHRLLRGAIFFLAGISFDARAKVRDVPTRFPRFSAIGRTTQVNFDFAKVLTRVDACLRVGQDCALGSDDQPRNAVVSSGGIARLEEDGFLRLGRRAGLHRGKTSEKPH